MAAKLRAPGWYRAFACVLLGIAFSVGLTAGIRALYGFDPVIDGNAITIVSMIAAPLLFLFAAGGVLACVGARHIGWLALASVLFWMIEIPKLFHREGPAQSTPPMVAGASAS